MHKGSVKFLVLGIGSSLNGFKFRVCMVYQAWVLGFSTSGFRVRVLGFMLRRRSLGLRGWGLWIRF